MAGVSSLNELTFRKLFTSKRQWSNERALS
jgi:hypothetical protein